MLQNLFLSAGAMKASTTWMYKVLNNHPEIYFTPEKEIHYFASVYGDEKGVLSDKNRVSRTRAYTAITPQSTIRGLRGRLQWSLKYLSDPVDDAWYEDLFSMKGGQTYCADFSNLYCHLPPEAWQEVAKLTHRLKVIYTMRDPIKRLWSHAKFHAQFIGKEHEIATWSPNDLSVFLRKPFMWKNAEYGNIVESLSSSLDKDSLGVYFFESIHQDQKKWVYDLEDFLGIAHFEYPKEVFAQRVNSSSKDVMPKWFPELFLKDVERICLQLEKLGHDVPESWLDY